MHYSDNHRDSPILIMWIPSFGADHTTPEYRHLMDACNYRMITPTFIGMEPNARLRPEISIENQLVLIRWLVSHLRRTFNPSHLIIAGSSCGGIMALRTAAGAESARQFDAVLAVDPDLEESDCFVTGLFADLDPESEGNAVDAVKEISLSCSTLSEWISMHAYILQCIEKMKDDFVPLIRLAKGFTAPYRNVDHAKDSPFIPWLRDACTNTRVVGCVFPDNSKKQRFIAELRMMHLDREVLGPSFKDGTMEFASATTHHEIITTEHLLKCIDEIAESL